MSQSDDPMAFEYSHWTTYIFAPLGDTSACGTAPKPVKWDVYQEA
jgi:hypothetical protein